MTTFCIGFYESYLSTGVGVDSKSVNVCHRELTVLFRRHSLNKKFLYMNMPPPKMRSTKQIHHAKYLSLILSSLCHRAYHSTECQAFQSSAVVQIGPPPIPSPRKRVLLPPLGPRSETQSHAGGEGGGTQSDDGTDTLVL